MKLLRHKLSTKLLQMLIFATVVTVFYSGKAIAVSTTDSAYPVSNTEICTRIDLNSLEELERLFISGTIQEMNCLSGYLRTNPLALSANTVKFLSHQLTVSIDGDQSKKFLESDAAIVSAYIVSLWSSLRRGKEEGIVFDYQKYKSWLLKIADLHTAIASYAIAPIMQYGSLADRESLLQQFAQFEEAGKVDIFIGLAIRCDEHSSKLLERLKQENISWWPNRPNLGESKCIEINRFKLEK